MGVSELVMSGHLVVMALVVFDSIDMKEGFTDAEGGDVQLDAHVTRQAKFYNMPHCRQIQTEAFRNKCNRRTLEVSYREQKNNGIHRATGEWTSLWDTT